MKDLIDPYTQLLFGKNAMTIPFNAVIQGDPKNKQVLAIVLIQGDHALKLMYNSKLTHQLIIGDAVIRPHIIVESNHLRGAGVTGIVTSGLSSMEDWINQGNLLLDSSNI